VVYGDRWSDAAAPLALLAVVGASRVAVELAYDFLVSAGESDTALRLNLLWLVTLVPTLIAGAHLAGIVGVAVGHVIVLAVVVLPAHLAALHRLGVGTASIVGPVTRPLVGGAAMALTAGAGLAAMPTDIARVAVAASLSILVYTVLVGLPLWRRHRRGELFIVPAGRGLVEAAA
jgi:O-antigen/teichoic acid export membrane protein